MHLIQAFVVQVFVKAGQQILQKWHINNLKRIGTESSILPRQSAK